MKKLLLALCFFVPSLTSAQDIAVELEPFPPVINEDGSGILQELLKAIERKSSLKFQIAIANYARAKKDLFDNKVQLIGLTPKGNETASFYQNAIELDWYFQATVDIYAKKRKNLDMKNLPKKTIGTLTGNADFFAMVTGIPRDRFIEVSKLEQLVKLIMKGRIKAAIFERASMMSTINKLQLGKIHYQKLTSIPASLAVKNSVSGQMLKETLDKAFNTINTKAYFTPLRYYNQLADAGIVTTISDKKSANCFKLQ
ncbi:transporter substrate-binding domain-containing protein [Thalassotalea sediminis]|uniref:transporter substrate-binding domain-containing protein n=1 Tax=Thalassotalea sediminis TaxID=1759089 RepID=UPI00257379DD|nr:transporter substrate-binding domain-containing protein [Thalassotalea sediminis]